MINSYDELIDRIETVRDDCRNTDWVDGSEMDSGFEAMADALDEVLEYVQNSGAADHKSKTGER